MRRRLGLFSRECDLISLSENPRTLLRTILEFGKTRRPPGTGVDSSDRDLRLRFSPRAERGSVAFRQA